jgi:hypothetical protein
LEYLLLLKKGEEIKVLPLLASLIRLRYLLQREEILERGFAPLSPTLPLPLLREGGQGDGLPIIPII